MARLIYGKSVKGASHVRSGMPCQDSFRIEEISPDLSIVAVADGHGSEKRPKSKNGSTIAVNVFCSVIVMSFFIVMVFYMFANNQVFSDSAVSFWIWFISYQLSKHKINTI